MMNSKWKHLLAYDKDTEKYVLTGHEDGVIFVCNLKTKTR